IAAGKPGTQFPSVFNTPYSGATLQPGDPATTGLGSFTYNGAIGLVPHLDSSAMYPITAISESGTTVTVTTAGASVAAGETILISNAPPGYNGTFKAISASSTKVTYKASKSGLLAGVSGTLVVPPVDGHVDPRQIMDVGVMNGNIPAPLMAIDEDDEFFLTL